MSQVSQFAIPKDQQTWKQKCFKLQNELLQVRIQEINLKRINRSLQQTLRIAMSEDLPQTQRNSTQRINLTWKEKYEQELERNMENQKYIKVLQGKRNTPSVTNTQKKRQYSTNTRVSVKTQTHARYTPTPLTTVDIFTNMNPQPQARKSVKKMEGFMQRLMKEKYAISDFGFDNYVLNYPIEIERGKDFYAYQKDPIEKLFGQVKGIKGKENFDCETEEQELPFKVRHNFGHKNMPARSISAQMMQKTIGKKLVMPSRLR